MALIKKAGKNKEIAEFLGKVLEYIGKIKTLQQRNVYIQNSNKK